MAGLMNASQVGSWGGGGEGEQIASTTISKPRVFNVPSAPTKTRSSPSAGSQLGFGTATKPAGLFAQRMPAPCAWQAAWKERRMPAEGAAAEVEGRAPPNLPPAAHHAASRGVCGQPPSHRSRPRVDARSFQAQTAPQRPSSAPPTRRHAHVRTHPPAVKNLPESRRRPARQEPASAVVSRTLPHEDIVVGRASPAAPTPRRQDRTQAGTTSRGCCSRYAASAAVTPQ